MSGEVAVEPPGTFKNIFNKLSGQPESYCRKSRYTFGRTLGVGAFGTVRCGKDTITGEEVAIKIILKKSLKGKEQMVIDELRMLQELHHPHIVGFRDWFESKDKFYIVTQLATGGEMFDRIIQQGKFTEHDASLVIVQILEALEYLHDQDIVHRDIKPENVLYLTPDDDSEIVLADFGIAKKLHSPDEKLTHAAGSPGYAAPEVIMGLGHGKPCDIWSLGVVAYTVLCGYSPFRSENATDFIAEVKHNNAVIFHADYWKDVSKDARRFIIKALQFNPDERPTATELLNDPWLVSIAKDHKEKDLLPNLKQGFNARAKFRQVIEVVKLNNRIKKLKEYQTEDDDDPNEINLFGEDGKEMKLLSGESSTLEGSTASSSPLYSWLRLQSALRSLDTSGNTQSQASLSEIKSPYKLDHAASSLEVSKKPGDKANKTKEKSKLSANAFVQLVHTASENQERVRTYKEHDPADDPGK